MTWYDVSALAADVLEGKGIEWASISLVSAGGLITLPS